MKAWCVSGFSILFLLLAPGYSAASEEKPLSRLTLRGEAVLQVPADQLNLSLGVVTEAATVEEALSRNSQKMDDVIRVLKKTGLGAEEYQTSRFGVQPQWSSRPKQAAPDWRPHIVGYRVSSQLALRTRKLELAGKLIEAAAEAGANEVGSLFFDLADPRLHRAQAIKTAAENARSDAQVLATALNLKIVRVLSLTLDHAQPHPRMETNRLMMSKAMAADSVAPPIEGGDIPVRATVEMVCEIAPQE